MSFNGNPRKNWNTHKMLEAAKAGAEEAGACVNYVLDAVLSNASMATNLYARTFSDSQEELTATLSL